jgi:hypothetical protein
MAKTPDSQLRAIRKYDTEKRQDVAVTCRMSLAELVELDAGRGELTRGAFVKQAALKALRTPPT